ncbi:MAG TPA: hypothetical protein VGG71_01530 [Chitinophagaceae bacterium]|jgi:ketosteroid isomerase-like protein
MKKIRTCLFAAGMFFIALQSGAQNLSTTIKVQAMDMARALMKNDFENFVKYMHPNIIAYAGGKEQMKNKMDSAYQAMKLFDVKFKRYWIGDPGEIVNYKDQLQAVLPESTTLKTPLGELTAETSMIVISPDKGKNWWFIDTNVYKVDKLKSILPDISPKLVIPPQKKPKLVPVDSTDKN